MPKVQLDEQMRLVVSWSEHFARSFEIRAVLLYSFQEKKQLMWLNVPSIFCQLKLYECIPFSTIASRLLVNHLASILLCHVIARIKFYEVEEISLLFDSSPLIYSYFVCLQPCCVEAAKPLALSGRAK